MATLFDITQQYREDLAKIQDLDLPPEVVLDTIEAMQGDFETKLRAVVAYARELEKMADMRREEAKRMVDGAKAMENRAESIMAYAQAMIAASGIVLPLRLPEFTLNLARNPPSCEITDASALAPHLINTEITIDMPGVITTEQRAALDAALVRILEGVRPTMDVSVKPDKRAVLGELKSLKDGETLPGAQMNPTSFRLSVR